MATFTNHTVTWHNEVLWLGAPLTFLSLPLGIVLALGWHRAPRALRVVWDLVALMSLVLVLVKLMATGCAQDLTLPLAVLLPLNLGVAAAGHVS